MLKSLLIPACLTLTLIGCGRDSERQTTAAPARPIESGSKQAPVPMPPFSPLMEKISNKWQNCTSAMERGYLAARVEGSLYPIAERGLPNTAIVKLLLGLQSESPNDKVMFVGVSPIFAENIKASFHGGSYWGMGKIVEYNKVTGEISIAVLNITCEDGYGRQFEWIPPNNSIPFLRDVERFGTTLQAKRDGPNMWVLDFGTNAKLISTVHFEPVQSN